MAATAYCTTEDIKNAVDFPGVGAPITDAAIQDFIDQSVEEIENIFNTKFGYINLSGTSTAGGVSASLVDSGSNFSFGTNDFEDWVVWIYSGTGKGQYRNILSNTSASLSIEPDFDTLLDSTSLYKVLKLGYKDETIDGSGTVNMVVNNAPLKKLIKLTIDNIDVTPGFVYQYPGGKLIMGGTAEVSRFSDNERQLVNLKYAYGVYPMPKVIKRLAICIAGIRTLIAQISGTYDDFTTISLPGGFNGSKGEPYVNIRAALDSMQREAKGIIYGAGDGDQLGADFRKAPSYRQFVRFG